MIKAYVLELDDKDQLVSLKNSDGEYLYANLIADDFERITLVDIKEVRKYFNEILDDEISENEAFGWKHTADVLKKIKNKL